jgi:lipopolysaccharide assembly protein A
MAKDVERSPNAGGKGLDPKLIVGAVLVVLLLVFVFQNRQKARIEFLFFEFDSPLWMMLGITALVGALIGYLGGRRTRRS